MKISHEAQEPNNLSILVSAMYEMAYILLSHENKDFADVMERGIAPVAAVLNLHRVTVFRCIDTDDSMRLVYLWKHGRSTSFAEELIISPLNPPVADWLSAFKAGEYIHTRIGDVSPAEAEFLSSFGVKSILCVPILIQKEFWGVITLENLEEDEYFAFDKLGPMRSAAHLCASAVVRYENEHEIAEKSELNRIMFDNAPIGLTLFDKDFKYIDCNEAVLEIYGTTREVYKDFFGSGEHSPEFQPDGEPSYEKAMRIIGRVMDGESVKVQWMHRTPAGEPLPTELTMTRTKRGNSYIGLGYIYDLREQNKLKENLEDALNEAHNANRAKSAFLANMSHEMRTPMNAIIGMTAIGKRAKTTEDKDYALSKIEDASSHLLGVINDVLDMAKIEADKLDLANVEYCFERMLKKVVSVINFRIDEKKQTFNVNVSPEIPRFIIGDDQRLAQVITNLLSNAVKFTPQGGAITLEAGLSADYGEECELNVKVTDTGIGISSEQHERLFQAFSQADIGTSREYGGTGLGLAICKRIIELMGGNISVQSTPGKGSCFSFTVRVKKGEKSPSSMLAPDVNWKNIRILAVDDSADVLGLFADIFSEIGVHGDTAPDGFAACHMVEKYGPYDVYFIDWLMPGMDGVELARRVKQAGGAKPSVVTMITAADWSAVKDEAQAAGVDKHLIKPLMTSSIIDCINECLGAPKPNEQDVLPQSGIYAGKRMLLAEDIEINREILICVLAETEIEIECAENGAEAVTLIEQNPGAYDIVFMDVQMPQMDGLTATRLIRERLADGANTRLPIIAMTANVFKSDIEQCIQAGMDGHLGKPLDLDKVIETLDKYLLS